MMTLVASAADSAIVLALGLAAAALLRRGSASLRHAVLAASILLASVMPVLELILPQVPIAAWGAPATAVSSGLTLSSNGIAGAAAAVTADSITGVSWPAVVVILYLCGAAVMSAALVTALVRLAAIRRRSSPAAGRWRELADELSRECGIAAGVEVLQSREPSLLVTCGVLSPAIVLPAGAAGWDDARIRIVLRHELAHVRRRDAVIHVAAEALRIVQWANPLVWIACRHLRQESEYACDDAVLGGGVEPTDYAAELVNVAKEMQGRRAAWVSAPAIAHPSTLERRIVAMLQRSRNRAPVTRRGWWAAALVALGVGLPVASAGVAPGEITAVALPAPEAPRAADTAPPRQPTPAPSAVPARGQAAGMLSGTVQDPSGAVVPGVELTLVNTATGASLPVVHTNAAGRFAFRDLQPARYTLVARLAGFTTTTKVVPIAAGDKFEAGIVLQLGTLQETITVACPAGAGALAGLQHLAARAIASVAPVLSAQEPPAAPLRVGGSIQPPRKLTHVSPTCPAAVPDGETTVRLTGRIGGDGLMAAVTPAAAEPGAQQPPVELTNSAIDAVHRWLFTPTLLNGQPVEVEIGVRIVFKRQ